MNIELEPFLIMIIKLCLLIVIQIVSFLLWKKVKQNDKDTPKDYKSFLFSKFNGILLTIIGIIFATLTYKSDKGIINIDDFNADIIVFGVIALIFGFGHLSDYLFKNTIRNEIYSNTLGKIYEFIITNQSIHESKLSRFDDNVINNVGYLKISDLIQNYKYLQDWKLPIINFEHFREIWESIMRSENKIKRLKLLEHLPNNFGMEEYKGLYFFYDDLKELSSSKNISVDRHVYTIDKTRWDEELAIILFSHLPYNGNYNIYLDIAHQNLESLILFVETNKNSYLLSVSMSNILKFNSYLDKDKNLLEIAKKGDYLNEKFEENNKRTDDKIKIKRNNVFEIIDDPLKQNFYNLYVQVHNDWMKHVINDYGNIYGTDTSMLNNDINDWLEKPFYKKVLEDNAYYAKRLIDNNSNHKIQRIFILSKKMRKNKINIVYKILKEHINNNILIGIVDTDWLITYIYREDNDYRNIFKDLRDFNFMENFNVNNTTSGIIYEICGLRKKFQNGNFYNHYIEPVPTYPYWQLYKNYTNNYLESISESSGFTEIQNENNEFERTYKQYQKLSDIAIWFDIKYDSEKSKDTISEKYQVLFQDSNRNLKIQNYIDRNINLHTLLEIISIEEHNWENQKCIFKDL